VERREASVLRKARGAFYEASNVTQRLSALRSLTCVREGKGRRTQKRVYARLRRAMAEQKNGDDESCLFVT